MGDLCKHDPASWHFCNFAKAPFDAIPVLLMAPLRNDTLFAQSSPCFMRSDTPSNPN